MGKQNALTLSMNHHQITLYHNYENNSQKTDDLLSTRVYDDFWRL